MASVQYYYRKTPMSDEHLPGKWLCCGIVDEKTRYFYEPYFALHDPRNPSKTFERSEIKIVEGYRGPAVDTL